MSFAGRIWAEGFSAEFALADIPPTYLLLQMGIHRAGGCMYSFLSVLSLPKGGGGLPDPWVQLVGSQDRSIRTHSLVGFGSEGMDPSSPQCPWLNDLHPVVTPVRGVRYELIIRRGVVSEALLCCVHEPSHYRL